MTMIASYVDMWYVHALLELVYWVDIFVSAIKKFGNKILSSQISEKTRVNMTQSLCEQIYQFDDTEPVVLLSICHRLVFKETFWQAIAISLSSCYKQQNLL